MIDPVQVVETFGPDALRYYLLAAVGFGQDGSVSPDDFESRYTAELANEYGNLASRTLAMINRYRDGVVPAADAPPELSRELDGLADRVCAHFDAIEITQAVGAVWALVRRLNQYVQDRAPWQLAKDAAADEQLDQVLYALAEGLRVVAVLLHPVMPDSTAKLLAALGQEDLSLAAARFAAVGGGARVGELEPLFPRIERAAA